MDNNKQTLQDEKLFENENFGLSIIAQNEEDLQLFEEICLKHFLPISKESSLVSSQCTQTMIEHYLTT
ncbi:unnamed protein product, partial [Rotaria socialis]